MGLLDRFVLASLPLVPRPLMRRLSARYIAGERLDQAIGKLTELGARGHSGILDILGEDVSDAAEAQGVLQSYRAAADAVAAAGLQAYVSVKPTHFGLRLGEPLCLALYGELAAHCKQRGLFLRVEMEDHTTTDATLRIYGALRERFDNVGVVLQSRLLRTPTDIDALARRLGNGALDVRLVKGIYLEPAEIAHTDPLAIRAAFVACAERMFDHGARISFATHDDLMALQLIDLVRRRGLGTEHYEFQVLLGVREPLWAEWLADGHPVRVYVPYGPEWRAYSQRRLRKNPEILRHVMRQTFGLAAR